MYPGSFRLLLAAIVVLHHSFPLRLGNWAVGMFFVLSGYWIANMWRRKYGKRDKPYLTFVVSRWWRLAPLFLFVQLFGAALVLMGLPVGDPTAIRSWEWWATQPPIVGSTQFARLLPPSWSLDVEMQFYLVAPILMILGLRSTRVATTLSLTCLFLWSAARLYSGATADTPQLDIFLWMFLAGVVSEQFDFHPPRWLALGSAAVVIGLVVVVLAMPQTRDILWKRGSEGVTDSFRPEAFFLLITLVAIPAAISTVHLKSGTFDRWLGDLSYPLYLCHWFSRDWYYSNVDWGRPGWQNGLLLLCNFVMAVIGAVALLHLVDRPAQRLRARWLAARASDAGTETIPNMASQSA